MVVEYLSPTYNFIFRGCQIAHWDTLNAKEVVLKTFGMGYVKMKTLELREKNTGNLRRYTYKIIHILSFISPRVAN